MKLFFILILIVIHVFASSKDLDLVMTDITRYDRTASSLGLSDAKLSFDTTTISYMAVRPNYLILASLKFIPKQHIGTTYAGSIPIDLKQDAWKYEIGGGYKFYLTERLFVSPALLFSDYYSTLYKVVNNKVSQSETHDVDVRFYGLIGYKIARATSLLVSLEIDNDILSDDYSKDYSQYPLSATVFQFLSKDWFMYLKYQQILRDKEARLDAAGNTDYISYGFGIGMKF